MPVEVWHVPVTQSAFVRHLLRQEVPLLAHFRLLGHAVIAPSAHIWLALHVGAASSSFVPMQLAAPHGVPAPYFRHFEPLGEQAPVSPHDAAPSSAQADAQQMPPTQNPLGHWLGLVHEAPLQNPPAHVCPDGHACPQAPQFASSEP